MNSLSRRDFVRQGAFALAALPLVRPALTAASAPAPALPEGGPVRLRWLEGIPASHHGCTWGVPWPRGTHQADAAFTLRSPSGDSIPIQSWTAATWPDGSLKWSAHAVAPATALADNLVLEPGTPANPKVAITISESADAIEIATGLLTCRLPRTGDNIIESLARAGRPTLRAARLVGSVQSDPDHASPELFGGRTQSLTIEQRGPLRAVVRLTGSHQLASGRAWLPFTLRLAFHAGADTIGITHTFVFDGDEHHDFIRSLGLRFEVPFTDPLYDRHVRFVSAAGGFWAEAVRGLTGLRRDPGREVREAQIAGHATPPVDSWSPRVSQRLELIPAWGDFTLTQPNANGFLLRKRTKPGHAWIDSAQGDRAAGAGYLGGASGGVAFALRDFWQLHPTQLDVRAATADAGEVTLWLWSPESPPMDLRFYHDEMGMETHAKQLEGLEITYEDYEPGFGTPHGVARTSDFVLRALGATPSRQELADFAAAASRPPQLVARPADYLAAGVFGRLWSLADSSTPARAAIEQRLHDSVVFYADQVGQRHWYGFWNYGDVMHAYDSDRHVWRYDVGGYAWDNSELSPDLWLWYQFLRTGDPVTFRLVEAMNRHGRDVDIYHLGRFAGFGSRHNVQHWGCSAKQLRISTAAYRRFHYYLTADARTGDMLAEVVNADAQLATLNPVRKLPGEPPVPAEARISVGTDWGSAAANWLTAWERTGDPKIRGWLEAAMHVIGDNPSGFFAESFGYDPATKRLIPRADPGIHVSHLSAVFGLVEMCAELIDLIDVPSFAKAWLRYCTLYSAPPAEQRAALGVALRDNSLVVAHSRLTAWAAHRTHDSALARRAWSEFRHRDSENPSFAPLHHFDPPAVLTPVDERASVYTNDSAQWGLAAIQNLALVPDAL